jgi:hypothetical protein
LFKHIVNLALVACCYSAHGANARNIVWDTSPKVHSFIVLNIHEIKRQIDIDDLTLINEIRSQLDCPSNVFNKKALHFISNENHTAVTFAIKLVNELSC